MLRFAQLLDEMVLCLCSQLCSLRRCSSSFGSSCGTICEEDLCLISCGLFRATVCMFVSLLGLFRATVLMVAGSDGFMLVYLCLQATIYCLFGSSCEDLRRGLLFYSVLTFPFYGLHVRLCLDFSVPQFAWLLDQMALCSCICV